MGWDDGRRTWTGFEGPGKCLLPVPSLPARVLRSRGPSPHTSQCAHQLADEVLCKKQWVYNTQADALTSLRKELGLASIRRCAISGSSMKVALAWGGAEGGGGV